MSREAEKRGKVPPLGSFPVGWIIESVGHGSIGREQRESERKALGPKEIKINIRYIYCVTLMRHDISD